MACKMRTFIKALGFEQEPELLALKEKYKISFTFANIESISDILYLFENLLILIKQIDR